MSESRGPVGFAPELVTAVLSAAAVATGRSTIDLVLNQREGVSVGPIRQT
jgi:hypothetical protein